jgi:hypothetical protein
VEPFACARIPVKLRFAKIQIADAPPCVPAELDEDVSIDIAMDANPINPVHKMHNRRIPFLSAIDGV